MRSRVSEPVAYRRNLPHIQTPGCWYHVTFALRPGVVLAPAELDIVFGLCRELDGRCWNIAALAVMPTNGTHVLCFPRQEEGEGGRFFALEKILHRVKFISAARINKLRGSHGPVWERESFDRQIRTARHFWIAAGYVAENPVKEGLAPDAFAYPWFWARFDIAAGMKTGAPGKSEAGSLPRDETAYWSAPA